MLRIAPKTCAWRKSRTHGTNELIEGMSEKKPKELVEPLWVFTFHVAKHKSIYLWFGYSCTHKCMIRGYTNQDQQLMKIFFVSQWKMWICEINSNFNVSFSIDKLCRFCMIHVYRHVYCLQVMVVIHWWLLSRVVNGLHISLRLAKNLKFDSCHSNVEHFRALSIAPTCHGCVEHIQSPHGP